MDVTEHEDRRLLEKLRVELPGILIWAIDGLKVLHKEAEFPRSASSNGIMQKWREHADSLYYFVSERVRKDRSGWVSKDDFYEGYVIFCEEHDARTKTKEEVGRQLPNHLAFARSERRRIESSRVHGWSGISLVSPPADEDAQKTLAEPAGPGGPSGPGVSLLREDTEGGGS